MSNKTGGPAFPTETYDLERQTVVREEGMTLRDYFAAAFVASGHVFTALSPGNTPEQVANQAYALADAMLEVRNAAQ
jgi:hypothetical protein